ncbi:MAG: cytochrome c-type biogenesis protein [Pseudomonadota bacterium]
MRRLFIYILAALLLSAWGAQAQEVTSSAPIVEDVDERTEAISKTLRCVVCQNQSIYDSNAPLAEDMRRLVRKRVEAGDTDDEAREYLRNLYGDYVLMSPPLQMNTILLWTGPLLLVLLGGVWFVFRLRQDGPSEQVPLSDEDRARVAAALSEKDASA